MAEEEEKNTKPALESENERLSPKTEEQNLSFFFFFFLFKKFQIFRANKSLNKLSEEEDKIDKQGSNEKEKENSKTEIKSDPPNNGNGYEYIFCYKITITL